ncbi:MAG: hypothetical protein KAR35_11300 [Candidatus Heimdallarchaeota archaeon]|nr:hypothetical protein [Candidatus Heimdallarchaeota archaeon]MCK5049946.1 hypothetical protein [Candidatus Heimdallarchaeota archaeon]
MSVLKFPIIVLCGSTKYYELFDKTSLEYTLNGWIVLSIGSHRVSDKNLEISKEQFEMLGELHRRKIDMADLVYIINKDGYMGQGTRDEIEYAKSQNKKIEYLEPI